MVCQSDCFEIGELKVKCLSNESLISIRKQGYGITNTILENKFINVRSWNIIKIPHSKTNNDIYKDAESVC